MRIRLQYYERMTKWNENLAAYAFLAILDGERVQALFIVATAFLRGYFFVPRELSAPAQ